MADDFSAPTRPPKLTVFTNDLSPPGRWPKTRINPLLKWLEALEGPEGYAVLTTGRKAGPVEKTVAETAAAIGCPRDGCSTTMLSVDKVIEVLAKARGSDRSIVIPSANDPAVLMLRMKLSVIRDMFHSDKAAASHDDVRGRRNLEKCIATARRELARKRDRLVGRGSWPKDYERRTGIIGTPTREDVSVAIAKIDIAEAALCDLSNSDVLLAPVALVQLDRWQVHAQRLAQIFAETVTRRGKNPPPLRNATYRFLEAAIPLVTGERVSFDAIRSQLARRRPVFRRK